MHLEIEERERKKRAALMTLATGILLFILMWWARGNTYMDPPLPEQGAIIEFGWDTEGSGETETETPTKTEQVPTQTVSQPVPQETSQEVVEEVVTETESEVAAEKPTETQSPKETVEEVVKEDPKPSDQLNEAMTDMWNSNSGGGGDGEEDKTGNKGEPKGDKNSKGVLQNGVGAFGAGSDRYVGGSIKVIEKPKEEGVIVLDIFVDRYGNYLRASWNSQSYSTNTYLINLAIKSAKATAKFKADHNSPVEQKITVRFEFKLE